jgi:hypothetical protein
MRPVLPYGPFLFADISSCRTRSEDSADQGGGRAAQKVLRKESEGEVTQGETEGFDRSDRACPEPVEEFTLSMPRACPEPVEGLVEGSYPGSQNLRAAFNGPFLNFNSLCRREPM